MGGAAENLHRSSSPLKRRASDIDREGTSSQNDVDMIPVPASDAPEPTTVSSQAANALVRIPNIDTQISAITTFCEEEAENIQKPGDSIFIVSNRWVDRVKARGSEARSKSKTEPEGEIGPVDNSDIIQQIIKDSDGKDFVQLKPGYGLEQFTLFPDTAWDLVVQWYGLMPGSQPIIRHAYNTAPVGAIPNVQYEFHPPVFTIHRLHGENNPINISQKLKAEDPDAPVFVFSRSTRYHDFLTKIKSKAGIPLTKKVQVWRVPRLQPAAEPVTVAANTATPPASRPTSPVNGASPVITQHQPQDSWKKLFLDLPSFTELERDSAREVINFVDSTTNVKYNGSMNLSMAGLGEDQTIVLDEWIEGESYVSNYVSKGIRPTSTALARTGAKSQSNSGRNSPAPSSGPMTRGRAQKNGRTIGTVGLSNLGNTCYMNSALQCVRSVEELTKYFLNGNAKDELNFSNPLGNNGHVAQAYQALLEDIYKDPAPTSVAPRHFKTTIGRYAPSFSGWGQQDSQEFLGFLLDGLQEDLSRVKKKPYIEKPDSTDEMVNNPEAIRALAAQVWDITKKRDDSVIADLFTGMYKSTLVCPVCAKVSITFDPFNNLTLQLPIESSWSHEIVYYPLNDRPVRISVDIDKNASILGMKQFVSKRVGVPAKRLFAAEEFKSKFYKVYNDYDTASAEVGSSDLVAIHELESEPSNWPGPAKSKKDKKTSSDSDDEALSNGEDSLTQRMLIPVFHRRPNTERSANKSRYSAAKAWIIDAVPHFVVLTPEEARNEDMIRRKVLEKVFTLTTQSIPKDLEEEREPSIADSGDADMILTTSSDADSSGGNKVVANSVDGDDELVDVTMSGSNESQLPAQSAASSTKQTEANAATPIELLFRKHRPKFIAPGSFLPAELQNLFTLNYFAPSGGEIIPTGWNVIDEDKTYPTLASRNPQIRQSPDSDSMSGYEGINGHNNSDYSETETFRPVANTRMNEESSDDDTGITQIVQPRVLPVRSAHIVSGLSRKEKRKSMKTYSKKGKPMARKLANKASQNFDQDAPDEGPLIRLGEGIIVDWDTAAWDYMFESDGSDDNLRGNRTWGKENTLLLQDPELDAKRKNRAQRRKNGITLEDCLDEFGKEEVLSEQDTWYCPRCKEHRRATKKFELWKTPDILVMHLKRFSSGQFRRDKLDVFVDFPVENLDLSSRVIETEDGKEEIYDLFAVDDHWGGLGGGHYTAYAKNFNDNQWYEYNDSSSSLLRDHSKVVSPSAYLLFYRRRSEVPLGGPRFQRILQEYDNPLESAEDEESGEDQSLVENSSQRGSSRALTGVGAARQPNGSENGVEMTTIDPSALDDLPDYQAHEADDEDAVPLLLGDAAMDDTIRESIEDEGIDVSMGYNNLNFPRETAASNWNFDGLGLTSLNNNSRNVVSGTGSEMDASDIVQHNSSASEGSMQGRIDDFDNADAIDDDGLPFEDPSPVPDLDDAAEAAAIGFQADMYDHLDSRTGPHLGGYRLGSGRGMPLAPVTFGRAGGVGLGPITLSNANNENFEVEEPATEIHLDDNDELKTD